MYDNTNCCAVETPHQCAHKDGSFKETMQETKNILAELLVMMGDTSMQLFADPPVEKTSVLESKCFADEVRIINNQAKTAIDAMADIRRKILG